MDGPSFLTLQTLGSREGIAHGFFTRAGGVSEGLYASLNCGPGSNDDPAAVEENRRRAMAALSLPAEALATLHQYHSAEAVAVEAPWGAERPKADAMVTGRPGIALGILTADCVPVLLADAQARVIGAAHAGWKGAFSGVVEAALEGMVRLGASRASITAGVGPAIEQRSYEVGPEFPERFIGQDPGNERFFMDSPREGHFLFDLKGYVAQRLAAAGVTQVEISPADTRGEPERFFSYRRATLAGEPDYGRGLSVITLEG